MTTDAPLKGHYKLFSPLALGDDLVLSNRVIMSPMTRSRADAETHVPHTQAATYYAQRASAGLVITEATAVSTQGYGWYGSPGMYTDDQERAWKEIVDAVHAQGGKIFMQLWHMGRRAHSSFNGGQQVVSASATTSPVDGQLKNSAGEPASFETARELELHEIQSIINDFEHAAMRAKRAGFDGVEIHGANGYLVDQFLQSSTNQRADEYGGSIENRAHFLLEIVGAVANVFALHRIGVRLSPNGAFGGMGSSDNHEQFLYTAAQLGDLGIGYVAVLGDGFGVHDKGPQVTLAEVKQAFGGLVVATVGFTRDSAEGAIGTGAVDAVAFGRAFLANPDLLERFLHDWQLNEEAPMDVWYDHAKGEQGYTSYGSYKPQ